MTILTKDLDKLKNYNPFKKKKEIKPKTQYIYFQVVVY